MAKVVLDPHKQRSQDIDGALRKLKKILDKDGIFKKFFEKEAFERPGEKRIRKQAAAVLRWKREVRKAALPRKQNSR